jgi:hypothetical protein
MAVLRSFLFSALWIPARWIPARWIPARWIPAPVMASLAVSRWLINGEMGMDPCGQRIDRRFGCAR